MQDEIPAVPPRALPKAMNSAGPTRPVPEGDAPVGDRAVSMGPLVSSSSSASSDSDLADASQPIGPARRLRVVSSRPLAGALDRAVANALRESGISLGRTPRRALQEAVRHEFSEELRGISRPIRGIPKSRFMEILRRSGNRLLVAREKAKAELDTLRGRTRRLIEAREATRREVEQNAREWADELVRDLEPEFRSALSGCESLGGEAAEALIGELNRRSRVVARKHWAESMRDRVREFESRMELYERRIAKLWDSLNETEAALRDLARKKVVDPGMASIYRTVQGMSDDEAERELKIAMLRDIFHANQALQHAAAAD